MHAGTYFAYLNWYSSLIREDKWKPPVDWLVGNSIQGSNGYTVNDKDCSVNAHLLFNYLSQGIMLFTLWGTGAKSLFVSSVERFETEQILLPRERVNVSYCILR